jgi:hypothetical protein
LHRERVDPATGGRRRQEPVAAGTLPDGAFVVTDGGSPQAWLVLGDELLRWTPAGYDGRRPRPEPDALLEPVTPPSLVEILRRGWSGVVPLLHPSAARG